MGFLIIFNLAPRHIAKPTIFAPKEGNKEKVITIIGINIQAKSPIVAITEKVVGRTLDNGLNPTKTKLTAAKTTNASWFRKKVTIGREVATPP